MPALPAILAFALSTASGAQPAEPSDVESVQCAPSPEVPADKTRLIIHVLDANAGTRIPAAKIFVTGEAGGREFEADQLGSRQIDGVPAGDYVVLADTQVGNDQVYLPSAPGQQCELIFRLGEVVQIEEEEEPASEEAIAEFRRRKEQGQVLKGVGIGVVTVGVALSIGSPMSLLLGPCGGDGTTGADCSNDLRRQLGIGFGVAGGLTLAGGIAMIVVGAKRSNKNKVSAAAFPTRGGAAFSLSGRF